MVIRRNSSRRVSVVRHGRVVDGGEAQRVEVVHPHRQRVQLEQRAVALLALAQGLLGALALGEVAGDVDHADGRAFVSRRNDDAASTSTRAPSAARQTMDARARPCC